jgi:hypothetical protein
MYQNSNQAQSYFQDSAYNLIYNNIGVKINQELRMLDEQHNHWTRAHIIRKAEGLPDLQEVSARQLRNVHDFAQFFSQFYGREKFLEIEELFQDHILIGSRIIDNLYRKDENALASDREKWTKNAEDLARVFASVSPYLSYDVLLNSILDHNKNVEQQAILRFNKQYDEEIRLFDHIEKDGLRFADYLSYGIIANFGFV